MLLYTYTTHVSIHVQWLIMHAIWPGSEERWHDQHSSQVHSKGSGATHDGLMLLHPGFHHAVCMYG